MFPFFQVIFEHFSLSTSLSLIWAFIFKNDLNFLLLVENLKLYAHVHVNRRIMKKKRQNSWHFGVLVLLTSPRNKQNGITMCRYKFTTFYQCFATLKGLYFDKSTG